MRPEIHTALVRAIPALAPWLDHGEPTGDPMSLARINNCYRRLVDGEGPCVTGFALLGDAANHTNPTGARGGSLGLAHAQQLARTVEQATGAPAAHAVDFDRWTGEHIGCWFRSQTAMDGAAMRAYAACLAGEEAAGPARTPLRLALRALAADDPEVRLPFLRDAHLLAPPDALEADPVLAAKAEAFIEKTRNAAPKPQGPSRREFEAIVGAR
jgi:2-polyprenyl-6-methoxyphenol hydroxylase-like FAD-dependent oxidoreductase